MPSLRTKTSEEGEAAERSNRSRSLGCKPSPRAAANSLNRSKEVIALYSRAVSRNVKRQGGSATPFLALELIYVFRRAILILEFKDKKRSADPARMLDLPSRKSRNPVTNDIDVRRLINFETATDGTAVRLVIEDTAGCTIGIIFTIETLSALLMTLPTMASNAVKRAHNDPTMRITYPVTELQIELSPGNFRILRSGLLTDSPSLSV